MTRRFHDAASRSVSLVVVLVSGLFDLDWYLAQVAQPGQGISRRLPRFLQRAWFAFHYVFRGADTGRSPNRLFEPQWFEPRPGPFVRRPSKKERQGLSQTGRGSFWTARLEPFAFYLLRGGVTLASPHPLFDANEYVRRHPEARRQPLKHFLRHATDATPMPLPVATGEGKRRVPFVSALAPDEVLTWGEARAELDRRLAVWIADTRRSRAKRVRDDHDAAADAALVARWGAETVPADPAGRPLVSVIMPVRNRPVQVLEAIASVRAQTHQDWELVVVDDGSTDDTAEVVAAVAAQDPRVKLVRGEGGRGVSAARNLAARSATGASICWLDSDNTWTEHYLHTMLAAMAAESVGVAYAAVEAIDGDRRRYRSLNPGTRREDLLALLEVANFVDLNVLVMRREIYDAAGGFDETLRRTVDYDLVWRVAEHEAVRHYPFIGVRYVEDETATDRITARELLSWREVVKNRHLVDWAELERTAPQRDEHLTSVLVSSRGGWIPAWGTAVTLLSDETLRTGPDGVELVVVDDAGSRSAALMLGCLPLLDRRVKVSRTPKASHRSLCTNLALRDSAGARVVLAETGVRFWPGWLAALEAPAAEGAAVVQPLVVTAGGVVDTAGSVFDGQSGVPEDLLAGHPVEDAERIGSAIPLAAVGESVALVRAADLIAVHGLDPLYVEGLELPDLSLRLARRSAGEEEKGLPRVAATAVASRVMRPGVARPAPAEVQEENRRLFASRWGEPPLPSDRELWLAAGFDRVESAEPPAGPVEHLSPEALALGADLGVELEQATPPAAVTIRLPQARTDGPPRLRWAIKTATPVGPAGEHWGDLHFADALARALEGLGQEVVVDRREGIDRPSAHLDDVVLVLRGLQSVRAQPGAVNLLWVISHPELVKPAEARDYDHVFAAGVTWARGFAEKTTVPVSPLLQATDPSRFTPTAAAPDSGDPVLFVGNSRNVYRPVVRSLVEAGQDVAVYGNAWEQYLPQGYLRGSYVPNDRLAAAYRSAGVVLNDHWDDMREQGFVSNRLFDAVASGARVVSDHIDGLDALFGGMVRTFRTPEEEVALVAEGPAAFPSEADALAVAARVARDHSFTARAQTLLDTALAARSHRTTTLPETLARTPS